MAVNATAVYQNSKVMTATPAELTLMLFDGAIKFCNMAVLSIEKNDMNNAHINIVKAENIIQEFRSTLDPKFPVAKDFDVMYDYIFRRLFDANIAKDTEILEEALGFIRDMRDTWKEAMKLAQ